MQELQLQRKTRDAQLLKAYTSGVVPPGAGPTNSASTSGVVPPGGTSNNGTTSAPQGGYTGSRYRNRSVNPLLY